MTPRDNGHVSHVSAAGHHADLAPGYIGVGGGVGPGQVPSPQLTLAEFLQK